jgi:hypothetical protein
VLSVTVSHFDPQRTRGEKNRGFCRTVSITVASGFNSQSPLSSPHARKCYGETIGGAGSAVDRRQEGGSLQPRPGRIMTELAVFLGPRNGPSSQEPGFGSSLVNTAGTTHGGAINRSWDPAAVIVEMVLHAASLARSRPFKNSSEILASPVKRPSPLATSRWRSAFANRDVYGSIRFPLDHIR